MSLAMRSPPVVVHVHVSGSAGTAMCCVARSQPPPPNSGVAGSAFNCLLDCQGQTAWKRWASVGGQAKDPYKHCMRPLATCKALEEHLRVRKYGVLTEMESALPESASREWPALNQRFRSRMTAMCNRTDCECYGCTHSSLFHHELPTPSSRQVSRHDPGSAHVIVVDRGAPSYLGDLWPLEGFQPMATFCSNLRYTFFMAEPIHRLTTQLLMQCPPASLHNHTCGTWGINVLRYIYSKDLVLDENDRIGFSGTPAANNYNLRLLLGPRVFFSRLDAPDATHHAACVRLLEQYALVAPTAGLGNTSELLSDALGWRNTLFPHANTHKRSTVMHDYLRVLRNEMGDEIRKHNEWDMQLYSWVSDRFAERLQRARSLQRPEHRRDIMRMQKTACGSGDALHNARMTTKKVVDKLNAEHETALIGHSRPMLENGAPGNR